MAHSMIQFLRRLANERTLVWLLFGAALISTHAAPQSASDKSRMATVQSLVEHGTMVIDQSVFVGTIDKVFIGGHFYSDKPAMPAIMGAVVYLPLYHLGFQLGLGTTLAYWAVTLLTVKLFWLLASIAFFRLLRFTSLDPQQRFLATVALSFCSLFWSWSGTFNNHELAGAFLAIGFYSFVSARRQVSVGHNLALAGFWLSLAGTADMPMGVYLALFGAVVLLSPELRPKLLSYLLPATAVMGAALAINYSIHGSIMPVQLVRSYFLYPGSYWLTSKEQLSGMGTNGAGFVIDYSIRCLIGERGFVLYNPLLVLAVIGLARELREPRGFRAEAVVVASGSVLVMGYYFLSTTNFGGWSYSIRWFVPMLPLIFFFLHRYLSDSGDRDRGRVFMALLFAGFVIASVGLFNPWTDTSVHSPFISNVLGIRWWLGAAVRERLGL